MKSISYILKVGAFIVFLATSGRIIADIYTPSLPAIAQHFSTTPDQVQLTISLFLLVFTPSLLIYGPLADSLGRKPIILIGAVLTLLGSILCLLASSIDMLIIGRMLQGLGCPAFVVVARTLLRDHFDGAQLASVASYLSLFISISPLVAPVAGGYIQHHVGWQGSFYAMILYCLLVIAIVTALFKESLKEKDTKVLKFKTLISSYTELLSDKRFIGYSLLPALAFAGGMAYLVLAPFYLQNILGMSPITFGWSALLIASGSIIGRVLCINVLKRHGPQCAIYIGLLLITVTGVLFVCYALASIQSAYALIFPMFLFMLATGLIFPSAMAQALQPYPHMAARASAIYAFIQNMGGLSGAFAMKFFSPDSYSPLAFFILLVSLVGWLAYWLITHYSIKTMEVSKV